MQKWIFPLVLLWMQSSMAQTATPKREFRAAWVATIGNIDWPSKKGLDIETQKEEFISIVNQLRKDRLNAVIVQIRPCADAFYDSPYENWSRYLTGNQGQSPGYDPLAFMVEEAHKRCIEFHAWFNPYRALIDANKNPNTTNHVTFQHPDWFVNYGGKKYFDPGIPEVRAYFTKVVLDVVKRYNIDAVHFDDYFYPYRIAHVEFPDQKTFLRYGNSFTNKEDWRRNNVTLLIEDLSKKIKQEKPFVKFGISPFGVWRNKNKDADGSATTAGQTNYDDLYADVILWLKKGWIDYILPQLYWETGHHAADYQSLIQWWGKHAYGKHVYIGHGVYQLGNGKLPWKNLAEMDHQIDLTRQTADVQGSSFYSMNVLRNNKLNINDQMQNVWYKYFALLPTMEWIDDEAPKPPKLKMSNGKDGYRLLQWTVDNPKKDELQYVIYRFEAKEKIDITQAKHILDIVRTNNYLDQHADGKDYVYVVTALDRGHNESSMSNVVE